jgi:hypothetical protein
MTTDAGNNDNKACETDDSGTENVASECAPGCACEKTAGTGSSRMKIAVCLVVLVAIVGIVLFKMTAARQNPALPGSSGFPTTVGVKSKGPVLSSAGQQGGSGAPLTAIADLDTVAAKLDTVFIVVPGKDNAPVKKEESAALAAVEQTLNAKGLSTGLFTLQTSSPDYSAVAAQVTPPGIAVLSRGGGTGFVSGGISEPKLMQAYVASTRRGGCGPGGCPPTAKGKAAVPCN